MRDIIALCPKCHGVKHMHNTEKIGYEENAKKHFCTINNCNMMDFANHYFEEQVKFDERNKIYRWKVIADLSKFGGKKIVWENRFLPMINNPYHNIDFTKQDKNEIFENYNNDNKNICVNFPKIRCIDVNNYASEITIVTDDVTKIECVSDEKVLYKKYSISNKFVANFSMENIENESIQFSFYTKTIVLKSKVFRLSKN